MLKKEDKRMKRIMCLLAVALMVFAFGSLTYAGETADSLPGPDYDVGQPTAPEGSISASTTFGNANIFQPTFPNPGTTNVYKDQNGVYQTNLIRFADYGSGGQKWKFIIATRKGDRAIYIFKENQLVKIVHVLRTPPVRGKITAKSYCNLAIMLN